MKFRNDFWRTDFLDYALESKRSSGGILLDVGAGESQYRALVEGKGLKYLSQDFAQYVPDEKLMGLQDPSWNYGTLDIICDITEIPTNLNLDLALCTDVLEHVPDPAAAIRSMVRALKPGGSLIVTVPLLSITHQAPYWFQPGLSLQWFEHWSSKLDLKIEHLQLQGDYVDWLSSEVFRAFSGNAFGRLFAGLTTRLLKMNRNQLPEQLLNSAALGITFIGTKNL
jgi:SAM-dependent methyltransferase